MSTANKFGIRETIVVFSHLRWEFVFQRPQHIMQEFAKRGYTIVFIEEPIGKKQGPEMYTQISPHKRIIVIQPHTDDITGLEYLSVVRRIKLKYVSIPPILWVYSPQFTPLLSLFPDSLTVYDCMDELSLFHGASPMLLHQEKLLFKKADIVFTGGISLYEAKKKYHANIYCFPSSVDKNHFSLKQSQLRKLPESIRHVPSPRVGYYGVIDERIDLILLQEISELLRDVSFVMIGPVVKITPDALPKAKNIVYLPMIPYAQIPKYLHAFDVAMMPFALNEATRFISPTKTLEFIAAFKPIVSTPVPDVVRSFSHVVSIARNAHEFGAHIVSSLHEAPLVKIKRIILKQQILNKTSWNATVDAMEQIMTDKKRQFIGDKQTILPKPYSIFPAYKMRGHIK